MRFLNYVFLALLVGSAMATSSTIAIANSDTPVQVHEGIWIESPIVTEGPQGVLEAYIVINNRTDRDLVVNSISAPGVGTVQIVKPTGEAISSPLRVPHHAELYMQPGGVRIQITQDPNQTPLQSPVLMVAIGPFDPVAVNLEFHKPGEPLPDHHDYRHCEDC